LFKKLLIFTCYHSSLLTYLLIWLYNQDLLEVCLRRSLHCTLSRPKFAQSRAQGAAGRCSRHPRTCISVFLGFVCLPARPYIGLWHLLSFAQRSAIYSDDIWAVELLIDFGILPAPVHTIYFFWAIYLAEILVWRARWDDRRCFRRPPKHLFAVWILFCISKPTSFFGVTRAPKYTNSLTTSKFLSPKTTVCPASTIFYFMYLIFCSLLFSPNLAASAFSARWASRTASKLLPTMSISSA
jgi:hypothetical protein